MTTSAAIARSASRRNAVLAMQTAQSQGVVEKKRALTVRSLRVFTYKMGQAADLLGVSVDTVRRWADSGRIQTVRTDGGHRLIDGVSLANFAVELARQHPAVAVAESARNHFLGLITDVAIDGVMAHVKLQAGPFRISSLISSEAVEELGLAPGMLAIAQVKATNVVIELAGPTSDLPSKKT